MVVTTYKHDTVVLEISNSIMSRYKEQAHRIDRIKIRQTCGLVPYIELISKR